MPADLFGDAPPKGYKPPASPDKESEEHKQVVNLRRAIAVAHNPDIYAMAAQIPDTTSGGPGRPGEFPVYIYLIFNALTAVFGSARATAANLRDPAIWAHIRVGVAHCLGQAEAYALPALGPTRNQWLYNRCTKLQPHVALLLERFRDQALTQARDHGLLDPNAPAAWSDPDQTQLVVGDGTIPKSPTTATKPTSVDPKTGEIRHHRIDPGAGLHTEAGDENNKVWGPKFVLLSARSRYYFDRVVLDIRYQPPNHPGAEAALATEAALDLFAKALGCLGLVYDGALRGTHRDAIAKAGRLAINKQHGGAAPGRLAPLKTLRCHHDLWSVDGRVAERLITDNGTAVYQPVPIQRLERRPTALTCRWYHVLTIDCRHGTHLHRVRIDQNPDDTKAKVNTCEHLRQIPPGTATFDRIYRYRPDSESLNAQLDTTWRHKRIIAYGSERQTLAMLGFAHTQNSIARHRRQLRTDTQLTKCAAA